MTFTRRENSALHAPKKQPGPDLDDLNRQLEAASREQESFAATLLHAQGGRIWANAGPGAGASFYFVPPGMSAETLASATG